MTKTAGLLSVFLRLATTNDTGQKYEFIHSFSLDMKADPEQSQAAFMFSGDFGGRHKCIVKMWFIGNQSKY